MSDAVTQPETGDVAETPSGPETGDTKDWKAEAEKWRALSRETEKKAKANAAELEQIRQQSMSDTERAVAQAKADGRAEAHAEVMSKLAAAELRAAAANRMSLEQLEALLEATNLAVFICEDGEIDRDKVQRFIDGIAPPLTEEETRPGFPDLGQGARGGSNMALNGDPLLRDLKAKLGVR